MNHIESGYARARIVAVIPAPADLANAAPRLPGFPVPYVSRTSTVQLPTIRMPSPLPSFIETWNKKSSFETRDQFPATSNALVTQYFGRNAAARANHAFPAGASGIIKEGSFFIGDVPNLPSRG